MLASNGFGGPPLWGPLCPLLVPPHTRYENVVIDFTKERADIQVYHPGLPCLCMGLSFLHRVVRAPSRSDKIVGNDFEQPQAGPAGRPSPKVS